MHLIIGGAFQGKLDYAKQEYRLADSDVCDCSAQMPDFSKQCICHLEMAAWNWLREGKEPKLEMAACRERWQDCVLICNDISAGVVPMEAEVRAWREAVGRMLNDLAPQAETVTRVFCGLPQRLKG